MPALATETPASPNRFLPEFVRFNGMGIPKSRSAALKNNA